MNNNKNLVETTVRYAQKGDVLVGSGTTLTWNPWAGVRTRKGYMNVEGVRKDGTPFKDEWNAGTRIQVLR